MQSLERSSASLTTKGKTLVAWHSMAEEVMEKIFSSLSDQDRCTAMLVCRRWREILQAPDLWRSRKFFLYGDRTQRAEQYLQILGRPLRRLKLSGWPKSAARDLETILKACGSNVARLDSLELAGRFNPVSRFIQALRNLLRVQTGLTELSLVFCHFTVKGGCNVLRALSRLWMTGERNDLLLHVGQFFFGWRDNETTLALHPDFIQELGRFRHILQKLHLCYVYLSRPLLEALTSNADGGLQNKLETLFLTYNGASSDEAPSDKDWEAAAKRCPRLRVLISSGLAGNVLTDVLRPGMPMTKLTINDPEYEKQSTNRPNDLIPRLLDYLSDHFSSTLTHLHVDFGEPWTPLQGSEALVKMVSRCALLKTLNLNMAVLEETALRALEAAAQNKLSSGPKRLTMNVLKEKPGLVKMVKSQTVEVASLWEWTRANSFLNY